MANNIWVEVVYAASPAQQWQYCLQVPVAATVMQVIQASGLLQACPQLQMHTAHIGIWGKIVPSDQPVSAGDRVEIYRGLLIDPKETRHNKVSKERRAARIEREKVLNPTQITRKPV